MVIASESKQGDAFLFVGYKYQHNSVHSVKQNEEVGVTLTPILSSFSWHGHLHLGKRAPFAMDHHVVDTRIPPHM